MSTPLNAQIAWRFLLAKKRAMLMSLGGIVFGVGLFVLTQAQTSGFERFFVETILGINGAVRVQDEFQDTVTTMLAQGESGGGFEVRLREGREYIPGIRHPQAILDALKPFASITAASPVLREDARISSGFRAETGRVLGIEAASYPEVSTLATQLIYGSWETYVQTPEAILLGRRLAESLEATLGDPLLVEFQGDTRRYVVTGIFETGVDVYDKSHFFIHLAEARVLLKQPTAATYIQVAVEDPDRAPQLAQHLEHVLHHYVADWQERERSWLEVFRVLRLSSALTMSTILVIAGLGMFNTLAIIVLERTREIAILRSLGFAAGDIRQIFLLQGLIVYAVGTVIGMVVGALLTWGVSHIEIRIRGIFATDHFLVHWSWGHYAWAALVAGVVVLFASYLPARRAAQVQPGEVIRGSAG